MTDKTPLEKTERIAKVMARAGLCSRREAERWISAGRVQVDGARLDSPAVTVTAASTILVDGKPIPKQEPSRLWRYHKAKGLLTTHNDPQGRPTLFDALPREMPRVLSIGRLDINSEGLLLLTNDGELARKLELPATGWIRRYRVRAYGRIAQKELDALAKGTTVEGLRYGPIDAKLDSQQGGNSWITMAIREGKNREVRRVLESIGMRVNRLIRVSYGPFHLGNLKIDQIDEVSPAALRDLVGAPYGVARKPGATARSKSEKKRKKDADHRRRS